MATLVSTPIDASAGTSDIKTRVDTVSPGANRRVATFTIGSKVVFVGYDIA